MSELFKRTLVAAVGIPLSILIIYVGDIYFVLAVIIISTLTLYEFYGLLKEKSSYPNKWIGLTANIVILILFYYFYTNQHIFDGGILFLSIFALILFLVLTVELFRYRHNPIMNISSTITGIIYITIPFMFMIGLREIYHLLWIMEQNILTAGFTTGLSKIFPNLNKETSGWLLFSIFASVWICDTAAYFIGLKFGKHKILPRVSPKKSWEGAIAGFFGGIFGFWLATHLLIPGIPLIHIIVIGAIVGTIGQIGDFAESQLKRDAGIKDSSGLIPGHGGFLDRFDSLLFVIPSVFIYFVVFIIINL